MTTVKIKIRLLEGAEIVATSNNAALAIGHLKMIPGGKVTEMDLPTPKGQVKINVKPYYRRTINGELTIFCEEVK